MSGNTHHDATLTMTLPSDPSRATQLSPMNQIYDAGPGAPKIVIVLRCDQGDEVLFRELCSALAIVAAEDPRYTVSVSTDAREGTHTPLDGYGNTLEQVLVAAAHEEVLFRNNRLKPPGSRFPGRR